MEFIKASYKILDQGGYDLVSIKKHIERCARVTYKSEHLITEDSYERFVNNLIKNHHDRPLEFGTVCLKMPIWEYYKHRLNELNVLWSRNKVDPTGVIITSNYRALLEHISKELPYNDASRVVDDLIVAYHTKSDNPFPRYTVKFVVDRGCMDDFRTHITLSHLAESTRWINYGKKGGITFIEPTWKEERPEEYEKMAKVLGDIEKVYLEMINQGLQPQQARQILPLSIKSELISCGFGDAWENFFYRRCDKSAHPQAQIIAKDLKDEFAKRLYINNLDQDGK